MSARIETMKEPRVIIELTPTEAVSLLSMCNAAIASNSETWSNSYSSEVKGMVEDAMFRSIQVKNKIKSAILSTED